MTDSGRRCWGWVLLAAGGAGIAGPAVLMSATARLIPLMLTHQVGAFLGAWMGGRVFQMTGSYDRMWIVGLITGLASGHHMRVASI